MIYTIYQLVDIELEYAFMRYGSAVRLGFDENNPLRDYEEFYSGVLEDEPGSTDDEYLEKIFTKFNRNHPAGYTGRSVSVSDIIDLNNQLYYCDSFGFVKL